MCSLFGDNSKRFFVNSGSIRLGYKLRSLEQPEKLVI